MVYFLILAAVVLRFLPHEPNFAPITALALFGGVYLANKKFAILLPLVVILVSDYFIGFYYWPILLSVYTSFAISGILGLWLRKRKNISNTLGVTLLASVQFFLLTNFAVWAFGTLYPHTGAGLLSAFTNALPFFRGTLYGDLIYVGVFFSFYEAVARYRSKNVNFSST